MLILKRCKTIPSSNKEGQFLSRVHISQTSKFKKVHSKWLRMRANIICRLRKPWLIYKNESKCKAALY